MGETGTGTESEPKNLESVASGASWYFIGRVLSAGLKFVLQTVLTRALGAAIYGVYTYAYSIVWLFVIVARLGTGKSLLRFIPEFEESPSKQSWVTAVAYGTAFLASILFGILLYFAAPTINSFTLESSRLIVGLRVFAIVLPFNTLINLTNTLFRAVNRVEYQVLVDNIATPIVQIFSVALAGALGTKFIGIVGAIGASSVLLFFIAISLLYRKVPIDILGPYEKDSYRQFYAFSMPLTLKDIGERIYSRSDILMIGFLLISVDIGVYRAAILMMGLLKIPLSGLNQVFPSVASKLHTKGEIKELEQLYSTVTRWSLTMGLVPSLVLLMYPSTVLSIFGDEFTAGANILVLFVVAQLTNMAVGPSGFLIMMTNHQYISLLNQWSSAVLNIIANYVLILQYGLIGAAIATAGTLAIINLVRVTEVQLIEGMNPYALNYWKPLIAGICCGVTMYLFKIALSGYQSLLLGSIIGSLIFLILITSTGIEQQDKEIFNEFIRPKLNL